MKQQLNHKNIDSMIPVQGWQSKVNRLNEWVASNNQKILDKRIELDLFHSVYITIYNRLKYTNWDVRNGNYMSFISGACWNLRLLESKTNSRYVRFEHDIKDVDDEYLEPLEILDSKKIDKCIKKLSERQRNVYEQIFIYRTTVKEASEQLNYPIKTTYNAYSNALLRIGQLYNNIN